MNTILKTGLFSGFLACAMMLLERYAPNSTVVAFAHYATILVYLAGIYLGVKRTRDEQHNKALEFKLGLKAGFSTAFVSASLMGIMMFILFLLMNPVDMMDEYVRNKVTSTEILSILRSMTIPTFIKGAVTITIFNLLVGLFMSIMSALVLSKRGGVLGTKDEA
ncbi:MAG: DUF4199 domain-containing protein [Bacteroidia bacterium]